MAILLNPFDNIQYASFFILGFESVFGDGSIRFEAEPFEGLSMKTKQTNGVLFVMPEGRRLIKGYISAGDFNSINEEIYAWCDVYASVNANSKKNPGRDKLISLAPSFAIRCWSPAGTVIHALLAGTKLFFDRSKIGSVKTFFGNYNRLLQRPKYCQMIPERSEDNYIFFCSTLWYSDQWNRNDEGLNLRRARFIRACREIPDLRFEGGLVSQPGRSSDELFSDCVRDNGYSYKVWLKNTKRSAVVFNTPAFWDCHGWKLGEYLALGKAIISTKLVNDLPSPLIHGEHVHFVESDEKSIRDAVELLIHDRPYREHLELGARKWWETFGTPEKSIMRILHKGEK